MPSVGTCGVLYRGSPEMSGQELCFRMISSRRLDIKRMPTGIRSAGPTNFQ